VPQPTALPRWTSHKSHACCFNGLSQTETTKFLIIWALMCVFWVPLLLCKKIRQQSHQHLWQNTWTRSFTEPCLQLEVFRRPIRRHRTMKVSILHHDIYSHQCLLTCFSNTTWVAPPTLQTTVIVGLIPQNLQLQAQVTVASLGWCQKPGACVKCVSR
jgi:hypothetical protein